MNGLKFDVRFIIVNVSASILCYFCFTVLQNWSSSHPASCSDSLRSTSAAQVLLTVRILVSLLAALQRRPLGVLLEQTQSFGVL